MVNRQNQLHTWQWQKMVLEPKMNVMLRVGWESNICFQERLDQSHFWRWNPQKMGLSLMGNSIKRQYPITDAHGKNTPWLVRWAINFAFFFKIGTKDDGNNKQLTVTSCRSSFCKKFIDVVSLYIGSCYFRSVLQDTQGPLGLQRRSRCMCRERGHFGIRQEPRRKCLCIVIGLWFYTWRWVRKTLNLQCSEVLKSKRLYRSDSIQKKFLEWPRQLKSILP